MPRSFLTALPVFNEAPYVDAVLDEVRLHSRDVLVVDDGSTDATAQSLQRRDDVRVVTHAKNRGYGAAVRTAFDYADHHGFDVLVTIDCDGQHEPQRIPRFAAACNNVDIVSGSRYLKQYDGDSEPPAQRRWINQQITAEINHRLGLDLTDAFCGFKAYRVKALKPLRLTENGYAMPLELWAQAAQHRLKIIELPVPLVYLDAARSFGGMLDEATKRLEYYHRVLDRSVAATQSPCGCDTEGIACGDGTG